VSCEGWRLPGCNWKLECWKGSNGTKAKGLFHNDMPSDDYLQAQMVGQIKKALAAFSPPNPLVSGSRFIQVGSGKCITTPDFGADPNGDKNGANIFLYDCYNAADTGYNQRWRSQD
jgi:hypothetical protein